MSLSCTKHGRRVIFTETAITHRKGKHEPCDSPTFKAKGETKTAKQLFDFARISASIQRGLDDVAAGRVGSLDEV